MIESADPILTRTEAAKYLRVSTTHLKKLEDGRLRGVPPLRHAALGRRTLFRKSWLDKWLEDASRNDAA
jgi:excisionase family DNA binding protein